MDKQKIRIIKKNDEYSMEYQPGDIFTVDSTWYGGVNVTRHSAWAYLPVRACRISCSMALSAGSLPARALWT